MRRGSSVMVAGSLALGAASALVAACESSAEEAPPALDAGDASSVDSARDVDVASFDASDPLIDAGPPPIVCENTPCAVEIASGFDSVCVRMSDGTVRCWGSNAAGELGRGPGAGAWSSTPAPVANLSDAVRLSGNASDPGDAYCALRAGGTAVCWGANGNGVLGRVTEAGVDTQSSPTPASPSALQEATGIFIGRYVACATFAGEKIACWGANRAGQIPRYPLNLDRPLSPISFALGAEGREIAIADRGTIVRTDRGLISWGLSGATSGSETGVLGREASPHVALPGKIELAHVSAVSASAGRACAIANGRVYCWGDGPTAGSDSVYPAWAGAGTSSAYAQTIAVGRRAACATLSDGAALCWGDNSRGQLGAGNVDHQATPVAVRNLAGKAARMAAMNATTCALLVTGVVQCWGLDDKGQLGTGATDGRPSLEPRNVVMTP